MVLQLCCVLGLDGIFFWDVAKSATESVNKMSSFKADHFTPEMLSEECAEYNISRFMVSKDLTAFFMNKGE